MSWVDEKNITYIIEIMESTKELATAGIRYQLFIQQKSQRWLAHQLGWDVNKLSRRLCGMTDFKISELDSIAAALGVDLEGLLTIPDEMRQKTEQEQAA